jgi:hypothetical protein
MSNDVSVFFFQKTPKTTKKIRYVYMRIAVDGTPREKSTKRKWPAERWDQKLGRAMGTKEDAKVLNAYLDSKEAQVYNARLALINESMPITAQDIFDRIDGKGLGKTTVLEEFQIHNDQMKALIRTENKPDLDYSKGTLERYITARSHVKDFIKFKYNRDVNSVIYLYKAERWRTPLQYANETAMLIQFDQFVKKKALSEKADFISAFNIFNNTDVSDQMKHKIQAFRFLRNYGGHSKSVNEYLETVIDSQPDCDNEIDSAFKLIRQIDIASSNLLINPPAIV